MTDWRRAIDDFLDDAADSLRSVRRHLHAHPEPSGAEFQTTHYLARLLEEAEIPSRVAPTGRGLIVDGGASPTARRVAIRADIDALQLHDVKEVAYRSTRDGVMHACGHDAHATMALGAAMALRRCRDALPGEVSWRAIFQPAEETGAGAREMIAAGAVEGVRAIVALHVDPELRAGRVARRVGAVTASVDDLEVTVRGRGGHAARPHHAIDPIAVACQFVTTVYALIPRAVDARDPVVVTFGAIRGGAGHNVIPDRVSLLGTIRALSRPSAERVRRRLMEVARGLAEASGAEVEIAFHRSVAEVINDPRVTEVCARAAAEVVGAEGVEAIPLPSMGGEDFGGYLAHAPGCLLRLGVAPPEGPGPRLHAPDFDIDERALVVGAKILARSAVLLSAEAPDHGTRLLRPQ